MIDKFLKVAQEGMGSSTPLQSLQDLSVRVKGLLASLTPMMQNLQANIPKINAMLQEIEQLKIQIGQLERMKSQIQQQVQTTQTKSSPAAADDQYNMDPMKYWVGRAWKGITELFPQKDQDNNNAPSSVAGVRGSRSINDLSVRGSTNKDDEDTDEFNNKLIKIHKEKCKDTLPAFWRRNLDYGENNGQKG